MIAKIIANRIKELAKAMDNLIEENYIVNKLNEIIQLFEAEVDRKRNYFDHHYLERSDNLYPELCLKEIITKKIVVESCSNFFKTRTEPNTTNLSEIHFKNFFNLLNLTAETTFLRSQLISGISSASMLPLQEALENMAVKIQLLDFAYYVCKKKCQGEELFKLPVGKLETLARELLEGRDTSIKEDNLFHAAAIQTLSNLYRDYIANEKKWEEMMAGFTLPKGFSLPKP